MALRSSVSSQTPITALRGRQNGATNVAITRRCLVGDKGSGSKGGGKKPKGGLKPGGKKSR